MYKFGDKVVIRDGSALNGVASIVCQIDEDKVSVLIDKEVIWPVDTCDLDYVIIPSVDTPSAI
jgi:hypothetical protein